MTLASLGGHIYGGENMGLAWMTPRYGAHHVRIGGMLVPVAREKLGRVNSGEV